MFCAVVGRNIGPGVAPAWQQVYGYLPTHTVCDGLASETVLFPVFACAVSVRLPYTAGIFSGDTGRGCGVIDKERARARPLAIGHVSRAVLVDGQRDFGRTENDRVGPRWQACRRRHQGRHGRAGQRRGTAEGRHGREAPDDRTSGPDRRRSQGESVRKWVRSSRI